MNVSSSIGRFLQPQDCTLQKGQLSSLATDDAAVCTVFGPAHFHI